MLFGQGKNLPLRRAKMLTVRIYACINLARVAFVLSATGQVMIFAHLRNVVDSSKCTILHFLIALCHRSVGERVTEYHGNHGQFLLCSSYNYQSPIFIRKLLDFFKCPLNYLKEKGSNSWGKVQACLASRMSQILVLRTCS